MMTKELTQTIVSGIVVPEHRARAKLNEDAVKSLMESMQQIGLREPIWLRGIGSYDVELIAGRHRLEAAKRLGWYEIDTYILWDATDLECRLWEISENLHRAELTKLERANHVGEWVELKEQDDKRKAEEARAKAEADGAKRKGKAKGNTAKVQSAQLAPIESKREDGRGHRSESGVNKAARELGIERTEVQRSVAIHALPEEAQEVARETGLDNNQSALLAATKAADPVDFLKEKAKRVEEKAEKKSGRVKEKFNGISELHYDFKRKRGMLMMEADYVCEMDRCIALFKSVDAEVKRIETFSGEKSDSIYTRSDDGEWSAK